MRNGLAPWRCKPAEADMADIAYLALGLGILAMMAAYAHWAART